MQHINPERIAALADEPATLAERTHLAECAACNAELSAAQRLVRMAVTDTPTIEQPLTSWDRLGPALHAQGLVNTPLSRDGTSDRTSDRAEVIPLGSTGPRQLRWVMQAAAGVFLAVGGAVVGRASAAAPADMLAGGAAQDTSFASTTEAMSVLQRSSDQYQRAVAYLAANDSSVSLHGRDAETLYQTRLNVLDQAVASARAALYRAPQDPVLNNYYLQSVGARDLTLRQLGQVVPVSNAKRTRF